VDSDQDANLQSKRALLEEMNAANVAAGGISVIKDFQRRWGEIGHVPVKQKDAIRKQYKETLDKMFSSLRSGGRERHIENFKGKIQNMKESGDKRLRFERDRLYNRVKQLESEIALLENNIGFFSKSKGAESLIKEVNDKIAKAKEDMAAAIEKINLIDKQQ
jgi:cell fate (sporulation/competence/biofilm development) regulator YlbF (YheA/YmcA/DUF963 family)